MSESEEDEELDEDWIIDPYDGDPDMEEDDDWRADEDE